MHWQRVIFAIVICHLLQFIILCCVFQESAVLQDVGGIRRVPGEQSEVSTTADMFKLSLCSAVFQATGPVVHTSDTL
jgi:hypothetical protein